MRPALVIFDCDGVLVDTGSVDTRVLSEVVTEAGWPMSPAEVNRRFKGMASVKIWEQVAVRLARALRPDIEESFRERQLVALEGEVRPVAGVEALLDAFPILYCVASNGPHRKMEATLGATGLLDRFEGRVFSRTEVARPKPAPDLFLHVASVMNAAPGACLVVEDSPLGIEAARAASMRSLGFAGTRTADADALAAAGADGVIQRIGDVLNWL